MKCPTCRTENAEDASFCASCGSSLSRVCWQCRHRNVPTAHFCAECGASVRQTGAVLPKRSDIPTIQTAGEGERKFVTILFGDIVDSTSLIENMEPDEAADQLFRVLNCMRDAVRRFDGTVNKMQGDGLMALFGAPIAQEDHAVRACCAALAMREAVAQLGPTKIRIGIHTGEAVVQTISNDLTSQYDAMGVAVHIAARIEQAADSSGIVLTLATRQASRGVINVDSLGARQFKGLSQPIELFALRGIRSVAASQQFLGGQRLTGFVGRTDELQKLKDALTRTIAGSSPVIGILGEPGAGKSRLAFEFIVDCGRQKIPIIEARAIAHGQVTPLQPVLELARSFFSISTGDSTEVARSKINSRLAGLGLIADGPMLMEFLGVRDATRQPKVVLEHQDLLAVFKRISMVVGKLTPAIVLFEDLHWLDEASEPFIRAIVDGLACSNVLVIFNFRPGYHREWMTREFYEQITLRPLRTDAVEALAAELLGYDESIASIRAQVVDRAAGNPFFAEELVRALVDQAVLAGARGSYRRIKSVAVGALPSSVRGVISFRIDRLEKAEKLFIECASVIGREFPVKAAAEVVGIDVPTAQAHVKKLLDLEMLYEHTDRAQEVLAFKHPLIQEVTYASLVIDRRRSLHRAAAKALSAHFSGSSGEHAALIAYHWDEGGEPAQAAASYMMSANWIGYRDPAQATRTWERVRKIVTTMPPAPHVNYMRMLACGQIINLSWRESIAIDRLRPFYDEAILIAKQQRDIRAAAFITMAYGRVLLAAGSADDYLAYIEEAQVLASEKSNPSVEAMLAVVQSHAVGQAGFLPRALFLNGSALERVGQIELADQATLGFDPKYWLWTLRARYLLLTNDPAGADNQLDKLLRGVSETEDLVHRAVALGICIDAASLNKDPQRARDAANQLEEVSSKNSGSLYLSVLSNYFCGVALLAADERVEARRRLSTAINTARDRHAGLELESLILANLAEASVEDNMTDAFQLAEEARRLARRRSQRVAELFANSSLIRIQARAANRVSEDSRSELDRLVEVTGASRLRLRVQDLIG